MALGRNALGFGNPKLARSYFEKALEGADTDAQKAQAWNALDALGDAGKEEKK